MVGLAKLQHWILHHQSWVVAAAVLAVTVTSSRAALRAWRLAVKLEGKEFDLRGRLLRPVVARLSPQSEGELRSLRTRLIRAGNFSDAAVSAFVASRLTSLGTALLVGIFLRITAFGNVGGLFVGAISLWLGWVLPDMLLDQRIAARQARVGRILPAVVDLLVLCLDVGLSLDASFEKVTQEVRSLEPVMAEEAEFMVREMQAGMTFAQALKRMADRIGIEELANLARLVTQSTELGASVTQALREYTEQSFQKRVLALEERAGKVSAALVLPLTTCFLPAVILALITPAVVQLAGAFTHY